MSPATDTHLRLAEGYQPPPFARWLASDHGTEAGAVISVLVDGTPPSGALLGKISATGHYILYTPGASDGTQTATGVLLGPVTAGTGLMLVHGMVNTANLPIPSGAGSVDAAARTALPLIRFT
jgi:hypothetical protein